MPRLTLLLVVFAVAACDPQHATPTAANASAEGVVFRRGNGGEPDTLDPHRNEESSGAAVIRDLFEGLTTETVEGHLAPGAAESWDITDDGLVYTFRLRSEASWSNGDPVLADDFVAGLRRTVDPLTASSYAQILYPILHARSVVQGERPVEDLGVRALEAQTVEITLASPTPYFLGLLAHPAAFPIHRASLAAHGSRFARPGNLVSNGAYRLSEWMVQSHIKLERNAHYWDNENVQIDTVYFLATENVDAELKRYRAGELDYTYQIPVSQYGWIQENLAEELYTDPYISTYFYGFDTTEPPFDDVRLRQALSMAIDRDTITSSVTGVGEVAAFGIVPPGVSDYDPARYAWAGWSDAERLAAARRLYADAGYSVTNPLRVEIRYNTSENHKRIAIGVASMWKEALGVEASLLNEEWKVMLQTRRDPSAWEVMRYGWVGDYNDAFTFLEIFQTGNGQNFTGFSDAEYDRLTRAAAREADAAARRQFMRDAERRLLQGYPVIPIYFYVSKHLVKPHVKGYAPNIMDHDYSRHYRIERN